MDVAQGYIRQKRLIVGSIPVSDIFHMCDSLEGAWVDSLLGTSMLFDLQTYGALLLFERNLFLLRNHSRNLTVRLLHVQFGSQID